MNGQSTYTKLQNLVEQGNEKLKQIIYLWDVMNPAKITKIIENNGRRIRSKDS